MHMVVNQILYPVVQGCETKDQKIIKVSWYENSLPNSNLRLKMVNFLDKMS